MEKFLSLEIILEGRMPEHEIEIVDYMKIIWRRKWLVLFGTLLVAIITGAFSLLLPKTFESIGIIQIGKIEGALIEAPNLIRARIEYSPHAEMFIKSNGLDISKKDLRLNIETRANAGLIRLTAKGPSPGITSKYIQYITDNIASSHREIVANSKQLNERSEKELEQRIASLEESISEMEKIARAKSTSPKDNVEKFILQNALTGKENLLMELKSRYTALQMKDLITKTFNTNLIILKTPTSPTQPKVRQNVLIAMFIGLMIFLVISLFLEYNRRERHNSEEKA